ncbi:MAG: L-fucose:H+ symporter permease [Spirochaetales bacterium]|nr:L-fucose:H+ symporter permease [Spirochaetales bacterium]
MEDVKCCDSCDCTEAASTAGTEGIGTNSSSTTKWVPIVPRNFLLPFILLTSCFAWWGLSNNMTDPLVRAFTGIFDNLSVFQSSMIQFAFYGAYFCLAIPGALIIRKFSYKTGVLAGLGMYIVGGLMFYPAAQIKQFWFFCLAFYVLAGGLSILETAANPYILKLGASKTATQRLNLAQSFNPVGSFIGTMMCQFFILARLEGLKKSDFATTDAFQSAQLDVVVLPYLGVAALLIMIWIAIAIVKMPKEKEIVSPENTFLKAIKRLSSNPNYVFSVIAQFFYVGAQITVWTYTVFYIETQLGLEPSAAMKYHTVAIILFGVTRFLCTGLMSFIKPAMLLTIMASLGALCTAVVVLGSGLIGVIALVGISVCMSLMFPTICGLGLEGVSNEDTKAGASFLVMAILGGALITPLQGFILGNTNPNISYIVPLVCFLVIISFALFNLKHKKRLAQG